jgi:uncharacterized protein (TIGR02246 family)
MRTMSKRLVPVLFALGALLGVIALGKFALGWHAAGADHPAAEQATKGKGKDPREADRAAIGKGLKSFLAAFERGDAKALAAHWTAEGEFIADDDTVIRGRAAIEKEYADYFAKHAKHKVEVEVESLRFPSQDTALEEGFFKVRKDKEELVGSRYSVLYVREQGKWLMAVLREFPAEPVSLRDLEWLIGAWQAKRDGAEVHTTYEWLDNKAFIRVQFTIKDKGHTFGGFKIIGKDAATGQLRSWTFEKSGAFGHAEWIRDGKKWLIDSAGVLPDGSTLSATNILTRLDDDSFTWQAINRTHDGEELPDDPPIKVTRVKAMK